MRRLAWEPSGWTTLRFPGLKPALGAREVRKVRGPLLDNLYTRLQRCGSLACAGKPFTEHRHVADRRPDPSGGRMVWEQAADKLREAISRGTRPRPRPKPAPNRKRRLRLPAAVPDADHVRCEQLL